MLGLFDGELTCTLTTAVDIEDWAIAQAIKSCEGEISSCFLQLQSLDTNGDAFVSFGIGTELKDKFNE